MAARRAVKRKAKTVRKRVTSKRIVKGGIRLPHQVSVFVPETMGNRKLSADKFNRRVSRTASFMSKEFGGDTTVRARGGFIGKGNKRISERVAVVESSMTKAQFKKSKPKLRKFLKKKKKSWKQQALGYESEGDFFSF
jgi:hypothetical protein